MYLINNWQNNSDVFLLNYLNKNGYSLKFAFYLELNLAQFIECKVLRCFIRNENLLNEIFFMPNK